LAASGDTEGFFRAAKDVIDKRNPPVVAFALIKGGQLYGDYYHASRGATPNENTLFPLASMSKWVTAYGTMLLSESGKLDLDRSVPEYLTRWHLPPSKFDNNKVTAHLLLSHRAGIHDHLGFGDYSATEVLPSLEESLAHPRASSGLPVVIGVTSDPGSEFDYSGGSYHLLELVVEEIAGTTFEQYMQDSVFKPLGMTRSSYDSIAELDNSVRSYTTTGELAPQYHYASSGATALNSSIHDLALLLRAQISGSGIKGPVSLAAIDSMRQPQTSTLGVPIWGMGAILSSKTDRGSYLFGHDGANDPAINTSAKINPDTGDGIVVLVNGNEGLATALTSQWAYWQTNTPDWFTLIVAFPRIQRVVMIGWAVIVGFAILILVLRRKVGRTVPVKT
jgi:CubicO group peptidase (beta-lactamase class C family)